MAVLKAGSRWKSAVCASELMVVVAPAGDMVLTCGGAPVIELAGGVASGGEIDPANKGGTQMGKRYTTAAGDLEVLCTKPGEGSLAVGGTPLEIKGAKPLPSSD